jgi:RES domain-containing protein
MSRGLDEALTPWIGSAYRHINADRASDVLDFSNAGRYGRNRWNIPGELTLYVAGDIGVAIAEWGRRLPVSFPDQVIRPVVRDVYRLQLRLDAVLDLRAPEIAPLLGLTGTPDVFRDVELARSTARRVRRSTRAQAMIVPSIAFLDDLTRWNLVIFLDKLPADRDAWITRVERVGPLSWEPGQKS